MKKSNNSHPLKPFDLSNRKRFNGFTPLETSRRRRLPHLRCGSLTGFTFIELLIVSSILAVVTLAIYSSFISGILLWQRSKNLNQAEFRAIVGLEKFSSALRQSIYFPPIGFKGTAQKLSFPFLDGSEIVQVSFEFDPLRKALNRSQQKYRDILEGKEAEAKAFIAAIEEADFLYYYFDNVSQKYLWKKEWKPADGIPLAIKITIKFKDGSKEKTVFIPIS